LRNDNNNDSSILSVRIDAFRYESNASNAAISLPEFDLKRGDVLVVSGRSGSGKSTLLHLATGVLALSRAQGSLHVGATELAGLSQVERDRLRPHIVGWIPQRVHLISALSVIENVMLPFTMGASSSPAIATLRGRARTLLDEVGIAALENASPAKLSVGQASRACAVRALVANPKLLCADEPSAALDRESANAIVRVFARYVREGGVALVASHDQSFIEALRTEVSSTRTISLEAR
jgi:putative ABC transport system ATP-binding protein